MQKEFIADERNAKGNDGITINYIAKHDDEENRSKKQRIQPLDDTFIHLLEDLLSSAALHRIKEQFLELEMLSSFRRGAARQDMVITSG